MHNLKEIRQDFETFKKDIQKRSTLTNFDKIKELDIKNREFIQKKESLEKEKKDISKSKDKSLFAKSKEISSEIEKINKQQIVIKKELDYIQKAVNDLGKKQQQQPYAVLNQNK